MEEKKVKKEVHLHINSLVKNLIVVNLDKKETSETIQKEVAEARLKQLRHLKIRNDYEKEKQS